MGILPPLNPLNHRANHFTQCRYKGAIFLGSLHDVAVLKNSGKGCVTLHQRIKQFHLNKSAINPKTV